MLIFPKSFPHDFNAGDTYTHVFVLSLIDINASLPFELIPEHFLNKAQPQQIVIFKNSINMARPIPITSFSYEVSERREVLGKQEGQISYVHDALPADQWKYWIISHNGYNDEIKNLQTACLLLNNEIEFGLQVYSQSEFSSYSLSSPAIVSYLAEDEELFLSRSIAHIKIDDLKRVGEYHSLIKALKPEYDHIRNALKLFDDLRALPRYSDFVIIGLLSIVESLISHSPQLDFYHDSIKHQIRTKIPLLRKQFIWELDYKEFFGNDTKEEKILSKLYDYRSAIVHTGSSEMPQELSGVLKGKKEVRAFLKRLTKQLLISSLRNPQMVTDLKSC